MQERNAADEKCFNPGNKNTKREVQTAYVDLYNIVTLMVVPISAFPEQVRTWYLLA